MVMVGPETAVRDFVQNLNQRLEKKNITPAYGIYTNNVYEQILEEPLKFDVIGDLKSKKAEAGMIRSFNTGALYEDDGGCAFYAASSGRVETLDSDPNGGISSSTQISIMSKDYNGTAQYSWDYSLYSYNAETGKWVEAGKNALTQSSVTVQKERGPLSDSHSTEPILASGRNELRVSARLNFGSGSPLTRDQIYRVEVRLHLNRENPNAGSESAETDLRKYTIVHSEYIAAVRRLGSGWGNTRIWTSTPGLWPDIQKALLCTPILEDLIANLEQMETEYGDNREFVEYIDFVFNVPQEDSLSVSDVVVLHQNGQDTAHYCDSVGFQQVPEFLRENPLRTAELSTEQNENMIDGVLNNALSLGELEAKAKAGEQISLTDLAAAVKAEEKAPKAKKSRAAKPKKPSIRAQLDAAKKEQSKQPPPREKTKELEV